MKKIPTTNELYDSISSDLRSKLNIIGNSLRNVLNAFALVLAGQIKLIYLFLGDIQDNCFPDRATTEKNGGTLERFGRMYLNREMFPDSTGVFNISVTGVIGSTLRSNLTFQSNADALNAGQVYILNSAHVMVSTTDIIEVRSTGAGVDYNLNIGDNLTITEPVIGVNKTVTVTSVTAQPTAAETEANYRKAILNAIQLEPQGGSPGDYIVWSSDAQGVRSVYPYVRNGNAGFVDIYVEATKVDSTDNLGTPTQTILDLVLAVVSQDPDVSKPTYERSRKPMQAKVFAIPITLVPVDITISGLSDQSQTVKDAIFSSVDTFLYGVRPYMDGVDLLRNKNDVLYSGNIQGVVTDTLTNGNFFNTLALFVNGNQITSYEFELGNIPFLNTITYN